MKNETLFISDLHLCSARPEITQRFLRFLERRTGNAERLYILGDLFDAYLGDDDNQSPNREIKTAFRRLTESGTKVYFQHGNRDFLVGERFARETGIGLLGDYEVIDLYGVPTLLTHGDLLCTDDVQYQKARERVRTDSWKRYALSKPLWLRRLYGRWYRFKSGLDKRGKSEEIMDVNPETVRATMLRYGVERLIHGHTHRPAVHELEIEKKRCQRFVLPEWGHGETVLCWNQEGFRTEAID
ncbi:UDP-2,3-diacylglucosamine diphosphatase [Methylocaldum szegediense]|uniref:UDP-2,3-diacylglucosamine hydrolase n=1 Tax=Methylocaldum szegediense TaxID=73780 RepID=A0ABM9HX57_9GAMM|nr:UDP-2,3-diacylglucosamine diphosphatase [Methylocaldum szegediense]CAI8743734.1 UDP-2,3-diacylglucosamine diphosphatase [Methylocaldum szegediense]